MLLFLCTGSPLQLGEKLIFFVSLFVQELWFSCSSRWKNGWAKTNIFHFIYFNLFVNLRVKTYTHSTLDSRWALSCDSRLFSVDEENSQAGRQSAKDVDAAGRIWQFEYAPRSPPLRQLSQLPPCLSSFNVRSLRLYCVDAIFRGIIFPKKNSIRFCCFLFPSTKAISFSSWKFSIPGSSAGSGEIISRKFACLCFNYDSVIHRNGIVKWAKKYQTIFHKFYFWTGEHSVSSHRTHRKTTRNGFFIPFFLPCCSTKYLPLLFLSQPHSIVF